MLGDSGEDMPSIGRVSDGIPQSDSTADTVGVKKNRFFHVHQGLGRYRCRPPSDIDASAFSALVDIRHVSGWSYILILFFDTMMFGVEFCLTRGIWSDRLCDPNIRS